VKDRAKRISLDDRSIAFAAPALSRAGLDRSGPARQDAPGVGGARVGDVIQFVRYAREVKALGATVLLLLRNRCGSWWRNGGVDAVFELGLPLPDFDYYIHVMSLPHTFGTEFATIPSQVPYLAARPSASRMAKPLPGRRRAECRNRLDRRSCQSSKSLQVDTAANT